MLGPDGYQYLRNFYNGLLIAGSEPFLIDLILDDSYLTEHTAYFLPGSLTLNGVSGTNYQVSAELEVRPLPYQNVDEDQNPSSVFNQINAY